MLISKRESRAQFATMVVRRCVGFSERLSEGGIAEIWHGRSGFSPFLKMIEWPWFTGGVSSGGLSVR